MPRRSGTRSPTANDLSKKISAQILTHITRENLPAGTHLTANALAEKFGVSRTPVRSALLLLEKHGIVRCEPHRGFFVNEFDPEQIQIVLSAQEAKDEKLYSQIAEDKVRGALPKEVTEADLIRRYNVDRNLLLSVLNKLALHGLISRKKGRGWIFLDVLDSPDALHESYNFRKIIEPAGILEKDFHLDRERADRCIAEHKRLLSSTNFSKAEIFQANAEFHEMIAASSGNRFILEAVQHQNRLRRFVEYGYKWQENPGWMRRTCDEHMGILEAILDNDMRLASNLMWHHLDRGSHASPEFSKPAIRHMWKNSTHG
tara:strand:- start:10207 stop:11154 length:948 start_codon:yes stop_codon:yes gene_type:complete